MSIKEIAAICGVSASTVSRVLRGIDPKYSSEEVKTRIWKAAQAIGYTPNRAAQVLQRSGHMADVFPHTPKTFAITLGRALSVDSNYFFRALSYAAMAEILRAGHRILPVASLLADFAPLEPIQSADAVIVIGRCPDAMIKKLQKRFPYLIYTGSNPVNDRVDQVICHGYDAAEMAVEKMIYSGYRRIAYIGGHNLSQRYKAYVDTLTKHGLPVDRRLIFFVDDITGDNVRAARQILQLAEPPEALFCNTDHNAVELIREYRRQGRIEALPAMISIENTLIAQNCSPTLSSIHIPSEEMGRMAARLLMDRMNGGHREAISCTFPCRYVERESFKQRLPI